MIDPQEHRSYTHSVFWLLSISLNYSKEKWREVAFANFSTGKKRTERVSVCFARVQRSMDEEIRDRLKIEAGGRGSREKQMCFFESNNSMNYGKERVRRKQELRSVNVYLPKKKEKYDSDALSPISLQVYID